MSASEACDCRPETGVSRRRFLQGMGALGAGILVTPALSSRAAFAANGTWAGPVLVVLSLRGGFDGLTAVAPVGDADYVRLRPGIGVPVARALPTGDRLFGLHPALAPLQPYWNAGTMAAVHAVGTPDGSRSHFTATEELERAAPGTSVRTGWLDRVLGATGTGSVFEAIQLGSGTPSSLLAGPAPALAAQTLAAFTLAGSDWLGGRMVDTLRALHAGVDLPAVVPAGLTLAALDTMGTVVAGVLPAQNGAVYPSDSELAGALKDAAALIRAQVGVQAITIDVGDWDLHAGLGAAGGGVMADKLRDLARSLAAFAQDLGPAAFAGVNVVTISEFGRRAEENGSGGADHGHGNAVLLMGGGLVGGRVHGRWPTLADSALDDGDLAGTTDYRDVLAELLVRRFSVTPTALTGIFPGLNPVRPGAFT